MNIFRNMNLRRVLSILLLFAALFSQIQLSYACDSMKDKPKHVCCCGEHDSVICPMENACSMHEKTAKTACCEVSYDIPLVTRMMNSVSTVDCLTLLLDSPQPPPDGDATQFFLTPLPLLSLQSSLADEPLVFSDGEPTYLLTRRLRL